MSGGGRRYVLLGEGGEEGVHFLQEGCELGVAGVLLAEGVDELVCLGGVRRENERKWGGNERGREQHE